MKNYFSLQLEFLKKYSMPDFYFVALDWWIIIYIISIYNREMIWIPITNIINIIEKIEIIINDNCN